jgi:hypothetical protein
MAASPYSPSIEPGHPKENLKVAKSSITKAKRSDRFAIAGIAIFDGIPPPESGAGLPCGLETVSE